MWGTKEHQRVHRGKGDAPGHSEGSLPDDLDPEFSIQIRGGEHQAREIM